MPGPETFPHADRTPESPAMIETLRRRPDFLAAARGRRQATAGFVLQARRRDSDTRDLPKDAERAATLPGPDLVRVGFTCSKKVGNAVARNRAKRRLREIARLVLPTHGRPGWDYVLIGRKDETAVRDFARLQTELAEAVERIHAPREKREPRPPE
ncbi:ribonuclease P protein component [Halovulum sp. GXIMD14794]